MTPVALCPGAVATEIARNGRSCFAQCIIPIFKCVAKKPNKGALLPVYCATSPDILSHPGAFY